MILYKCGMPHKYIGKEYDCYNVPMKKEMLTVSKYTVSSKTGAMHRTLSKHMVSYSSGTMYYLHNQSTVYVKQEFSICSLTL
jgi:hypothetical protein